MCCKDCKQLHCYLEHPELLNIILNFMVKNNNSASLGEILNHLRKLNINLEELSYHINKTLHYLRVNNVIERKSEFTYIIN